MKHGEHKKQMAALKRKMRMVGQMVMDIADMDDMEEKVKEAVKKPKYADKN